MLNLDMGCHRPISPQETRWSKITVNHCRYHVLDDLIKFILVFDNSFAKHNLINLIIYLLCNLWFFCSWFGICLRSSIYLLFSHIMCNVFIHGIGINLLEVHCTTHMLRVSGVVYCLFVMKNEIFLDLSKTK
jgi:hypothetical protein